MTTEQSEQLWSDGEPIYQPLHDRGLSYREPTGRTSPTGWFRGQTEVSREEVAELLGVEVREVVQWEEATDLACEAECRADEDLGW